MIVRLNLEVKAFMFSTFNLLSYTVTMCVAKTVILDKICAIMPA